MQNLNWAWWAQFLSYNLQTFQIWIFLEDVQIILVSFLAVSFSLNFEKNLKSLPVQVSVVSGVVCTFQKGNYVVFLDLLSEIWLKLSGCKISCLKTKEDDFTLSIKMHLIVVPNFPAKADCQR